MIDFPSNPTPGVTTHTVGRKTWKCIGLDGTGRGIWDLTSTPDSYADAIADVQARWFRGAGSPQGVVVAPVGSLYTRTDGGAGTTLYVKESGVGSAGWVAK